MYFNQFTEHIKAINEGMELVLDGKHNVTAYLPLENFVGRICGRPQINIQDL